MCEINPAGAASPRGSFCKNAIDNKTNRSLTAIPLSDDVHGPETF